ncbi:hypothetical protein AAFP35_20795, partial [Gordonia sp. CPCC 206044]
HPLLPARNWPSGCPRNGGNLKTVKYDLSCPETFDSLDHAQQWTSRFLHAYADEHRHSGIGCYTPGSVFDGSFIHTHARRQDRLDQLYTSHPERYRQQRPRAPLVPAIVGINHKPTRKPRTQITDLSQTG